MLQWLERVWAKALDEDETLSGIVLMVIALTLGGAITLICTFVLYFTMGRIESLTGWH